MNTLKNIIRIGIGIFFIVSAILKLFGLDHFELYIYSFNLMSLTLSGLMARAIIAAEILVGILLIIKVRYKEAWWLTLLMLIGFSLLLIYVMIFRDDSNCHCMGELVEIKPWISLIKNLIATALLLLVRNEDDYQFGSLGRKLALVGAFSAAIIPPFVLFPVDDVYTLFSKDNKPDFNETNFNGLMADSSMQEISFDDGNYIVGVVSARCEYCHTASLKMSEIVKNNQLDSNRVVYFIWGDSVGVCLFPSETHSECFRFIQISPIQAIRVVNGHFPTYLFIRDGEVLNTADLRHLTEKKIKNHLQ